MFFHNKVLISLFLILTLFFVNDNEATQSKEHIQLSSQIKDCQNIFDYGIYDQYIHQFREFVKQKTSIEAFSQGEQFSQKTWELLNLPIGKDYQKNHGKMLALLRELIHKKDLLHYHPDDVSAVQFIDDLCYWMYTSPCLVPAYSQFIKTILPAISEQNIANYEFTNLIGRIHQSIKTNTQFSGYYSWPELTDDHSAGYTPSYLYNAFNTSFIITPRIVYKKWNQGIVPEFLCYLSNMRLQGQKHLYINLMCREGREKDYSAAIENLSTQMPFEETFFVATLDKSSDFYHQRNEFKKYSEATYFKKQFLKKMFSSVGQYRWPHQLDKNELKNQWRLLIENVHKIFFTSKEELTQQERCDFIEISYLYIIKKLCEVIQPRNANISCYSTIDRGPSLLSMVYALDCFEKNQILSTQEKKTFLTLLFAPPLLSHNRPSHDAKIERIQSVLNRFGK